MKNVVEYLINNSQDGKIAIKDEKKDVSYEQLKNSVFRIASSIGKIINSRTAVGVYMEQSADSIISFLSIAYAGCFYSTLNVDLPETRLLQIVEVLDPKLIITSDSLLENAKSLFPNTLIKTINELLVCEKDDFLLNRRLSSQIDTDPLYINFTSGSTGIPKGIIVSHRSVIDFIDYFVELFGICENDVIANQAPFDFDVSVKDIYSCLKAGATILVIPRRLFSSPTGLIDYLCDNNTTTMIWAVSALCLLSTFHSLEYRVPSSVNKVLFSGEIMPYKALKYYKTYLPNAMFVNLYGPTEITCNCTYHILDSDRDYCEGIPIGKPFPNEDVFLLDENDLIILDMDKVGEICVRGTCLALGYYLNDEQNKKHFVSNPVNNKYPELIYRTGDLGKYKTNNELLFAGRKDFQIKYMGHRIELEEIEHEMSLIDGVERCCCIFDDKKSRLKGYYIGSIEKEDLYSKMKNDLPIFMIPGILKKIDKFPLNKNGKIDRKLLATSEEYK